MPGPKPEDFHHGGLGFYPPVGSKPAAPPKYSANFDADTSMDTSANFAADTSADTSADFSADFGFGDQHPSRN